MEAQSVKSTAHNQDGDFSRFPLLLALQWAMIVESFNSKLTMKVNCTHLYIHPNNICGVYDLLPCVFPADCLNVKFHMVFCNCKFCLLSAQKFEDNSDLVDASCKDYDLFEH
ncbi:hypothetical protein NC651_003573 [Populus alba x Populus x berolinensis]|nr:hypothetical protein NC651_003573 [Populus alba x Populus x berolinensis]